MEPNETGADIGTGDEAIGRSGMVSIPAPFLASRERYGEDSTPDTPVPTWEIDLSPRRSE
ncbi:MAG: hypothetical protein QOF33_3526 [Thermomicrobiales bacterium]|nr:hypothetical protein [Thermomicrobiales bacterium]